MARSKIDWEWDTHLPAKQIIQATHNLINCTMRTRTSERCRREDSTGVDASDRQVRRVGLIGMCGVRGDMSGRAIFFNRLRSCWGDFVVTDTKPLKYCNRLKRGYNIHTKEAFLPNAFSNTLPIVMRIFLITTNGMYEES